MSDSTKKFVITRFDPDKDEEPRTQAYEIPVQSDWKVLDAINFIKDEIDGTLSHRWSCRMAVCGSCGLAHPICPRGGALGRSCCLRAALRVDVHRDSQD